MRDKHKWSYYKLSRKYSASELKDFYIANFIEGHANWIGDFLTPEADECYTAWMKRNQSLTYFFNQDLDNIFTRGIKGVVRVQDGQHPELLIMLMRKKVSIESVIILNTFIHFLDKWKTSITDDIIWPKYDLLITKYTPFVLHYDRIKMKAIILNKLKEYKHDTTDR